MIEAKDVKDWKIFIKAICWFSVFCERFPWGCRKCLEDRQYAIIPKVDCANQK